MIERASHRKEPSLPLSLASGQRIVTPGLEPVMGWIGGESARTAQALVLPQRLLEPCATTSIAYACNLPAARPGDREASGKPELDQQLAYAGTIECQAEAAFHAMSLPGGQIPIIGDKGSRDIISFRWTCITAHASIGAVWRCFLKLRTPLGAGLWTGAGHDYVFEAGGGALLNGTGSLKVVLGGRSYALSHLDGMLTCLPSRSGRVKVTRASADGWAKRELTSLMLCPDRGIVARFSDGAQARIATAASARTAAAATA